MSVESPPGLPARLLDAARRALATGDAVIGPADDGGFYLLGLTRCPAGLLAAHRAHEALGAARALVHTGPTGNNLGDLWMVWRTRTSRQE